MRTADAGLFHHAHFAIIKGNQVIKRAFEVMTVLVGMKLVLG